MLSRELMGVLCLGIVWVTALLVAAAAVQDLLELRRIARRARRAIVGIVESDALATWTVEQTARAIDAPHDEAIAFHDRAFKSDITGGTIRSGDVTYDIGEVARGQVWVASDARQWATACESEASFDEVYAHARKAKGHRRSVRVDIGKGERVFVVGRVDGQHIIPEIVSTIDLVAYCSRKSLLVTFFILVELALCAAATWLALQPPHFGKASVAGAICCFAFFLGVTPIAVALRERVRRPHDTFLRVEWSRAAVQTRRTAVKGAARAQRLTQRKT